MASALETCPFRGHSPVNGVILSDLSAEALSFTGPGAPKWGT
jgi:hypothetical protein